MKLVKTIQLIHACTHKARVGGVSVNFVPTMGALHDGHLSLVKNAKIDKGFVVVSIFVNPRQFNNPTDFDKYPNQLEKDLALLRNEGVDCVFLPNVDEMYGKEALLNFNFGYLETIMEGQYRPGHFNGVATIVAKLFNSVKPDRVYLGQKDVQQVAVIRSLVETLAFQLELVIVPTLREESGLAMSSRNQRLSKQELVVAVQVFQTLVSLKNGLLDSGVFCELKEKELIKLEQKHGFRVEYIELAKAASLEIAPTIDIGEDYVICIAAYLGEVRLIDNLEFVSE
jgi:pantoate--beta-alanine ligase